MPEYRLKLTLQTITSSENIIDTYQVTEACRNVEDIRLSIKVLENNIESFVRRRLEN